MARYEVTMTYDDSWKHDDIEEMTTQELVKRFPWGKIIFEADSFDGMEWTVDLTHYIIKPMY